MLYCQKCQLLCDGDRCPVCGQNSLRPPKPDDYCFLADKELMWAEMLKEVLEDNDIAFTYRTVLGAGLSLTLGPGFERNQIFVKYAEYDRALDMLNELFSESEDCIIMTCPDCGKELKKGTVKVSNAGSLTQGLTGISWCPEEDKHKLYKKGIIMLNLETVGYYCDECMKVFAVFDEK